MPFLLVVSSRHHPRSTEVSARLESTTALIASVPRRRPVAGEPALSEANGTPALPTYRAATALLFKMTRFANDRTWLALRRGRRSVATSAPEEAHRIASLTRAAIRADPSRRSQS